MLNSKWLKNLWTNFLEIYNSTIDFALIFIKVIQLSMFSIQIPRNFFFMHKIQNFKKFPVKFKFFLQIKVVPIIYEWGKVEKVQSNKTGITIYSWTVCRRHSKHKTVNNFETTKDIQIILFWWIPMILW